MTPAIYHTLVYLFPHTKDKPDRNCHNSVATYSSNIYVQVNDYIHDE
ncbi:MAG TPA: hypothetical protein VD927_06310 [Chryseosolibacter sp.]|nr:hypothetical protein [Chryseosolibacter sp.]